MRHFTPPRTRGGYQPRWALLRDLLTHPPGAARCRQRVRGLQCLQQAPADFSGHHGTQELKKLLSGQT